MYSYALVAYLDKASESKWIKLWQELAEKEITDYGVKTIGKRPHITLADYENLDLDKFRTLFNEFYKDKNKIEINLNILGTFVGSNTLFLAPTLSEELLKFHSDHHSVFSEFNDNKESLYLPGKWTPHCTIASRLNANNMIKAFDYCKNEFSKISGELAEVALLQVKMNDKGIAIEDKVIDRIYLV